jgi:hypothetical protein
MYFSITKAISVCIKVFIFEDKRVISAKFLWHTLFSTNKVCIINQKGSNGALLDSTYGMGRSGLSIYGGEIFPTGPI